MYAVVQMGSKTFRSASATNLRICRPFWARAGGTPSPIVAAAPTAPPITRRRLMRFILEPSRPRTRVPFPSDPDRHAPVDEDDLPGDVGRLVRRQEGVDGGDLP